MAYIETWFRFQILLLYCEVKPSQCNSLSYAKCSSSSWTHLGRTVASPIAHFKVELLCALIEVSTKCNFKLLFLSVVQNYIDLIIRGALFVATCSFGFVAIFFFLQNFTKLFTLCAVHLEFFLIKKKPEMFIF